jgi:hypothetical protein
MKDVDFENLDCDDVTMYFDMNKKEFKDFTKSEEQNLTYLGSANTFYPVLRRIKPKSYARGAVSGFYNRYSNKDGYYVNKYGVCLKNATEEKFLGLYKKTPIKIYVPKCSLSIKYYEDKDDSNKTKIILELLPDTIRDNYRNSLTGPHQTFKDRQLFCSDNGNPDKVNKMFDYAIENYPKEAEAIEGLRCLYSLSGFGRFTSADVKNSIEGKELSVAYFN